MSTLHLDQRQDILNLLAAKAKRGEETSCYELCQHALNYRARVSELRALGHIIENRTERVNGKLYSYYKLLPNRAGSSDSVRQSTPIAKPRTPKKPVESTPTLFDIRPLSRYPD
jgi:hypothetical protein